MPPTDRAANPAREPWVDFEAARIAEARATRGARLAALGLSPREKLTPAEARCVCQFMAMIDRRGRRAA